MEGRGNMIEVLGVPDVLPDDWTIDKLLIHFLRAKHGGGEVLKVLYPCYQPGQAFIVFEEPEVAVRVLQKSPHVLELRDQQYHLKVKAANNVGMDFPVEATLHLNIFPNKRQVREIVQSQGLTMTDLSGDRVRVKGSFLKLRAVKASLEQLLDPETKTDITPSSSSPVPRVSPEAISKRDTTRRQEGSRHEPPHASPSSPTTSSSRGFSSSNHHSTSSRTDQRDSLRESFVVDADVYEYAKQHRKKDIDVILYSHNVTKEESKFGDSCNVTLHGKKATTAVNQLQSLLNDLSTSLRTQEVSLEDLDHEGKALLKEIQKNKNICKSVLVCEKNDKLHLIGASGESFEVKQKLLGRPLDQSGRTGRTGRTSDRDSRRRSSSLPPTNRKDTQRDTGAFTNPAPVGAAGSSPSRYQDDKQEAAAGFSFLRRRSHSESRQINKAERKERTNDNVQDTKNKHEPPKLSKKHFQNLLPLNPLNIRKNFKKSQKMRREFKV